ncbi:hypothetical protein A5658_04850 [Mycobacterium sp. 1245111.1]|uniref:DUF2637 domain-containing protein n=1 Tax=Mycobacterium sp. 1245111.1 TaxID=1834073 RepID=UPI0008009C9E|nr:DUF2637 domain-containing protein [Mycobacterium sp. 1245111.1]OBK36989.1 hypothetical protein A5658_04850 [Mycobacterium sp. 1245111.1]
MTTIAANTPPRAEESPEPTVRKIRRFFWTLLMLATAASCAGNVAHAVLNPACRLPALIAAGIAIAPPAVLLATTHGAGLRSRVAGGGGFRYWAARVIAVLLGAGAFALSFDALRGLALAGGIRPSLTWIWPLMLDLSIAYATLELFGLPGQPAAAPPSGTSHPHPLPNADHQAGPPPAEPRSHREHPRVVAAHDRVNVEIQPPGLRAIRSTNTPDTGRELDDEINVVNCDGCDATELADESHPGRSAEARRRRGWVSNSELGAARRDFCPSCAPDQPRVRHSDELTDAHIA